MLNNSAVATSDASIRVVLRENLKNTYRNDHGTVIFEELGVAHGSARVDIAVVNGIMHGYEVKSDLDTLRRLPEQMGMYNSVFDKVTLVVGSTHLINAFKKIPEWWGVETARMDEDGAVFFNKIREPRNNPQQHKVSIARLLWRREALEKLETLGKANGVRSKPREAIYERLAESLELKPLKDYVRGVLQHSRKDWRSGVRLA
jgi:hypothetical protein